MDLKFRRNLPLLLLFLSVVFILTLVFGNQPIVAYTIESAGVNDSSSVIESDLVDDAVEFSGLTATEAVEIGAPGGASESVGNDAVSGLADEPTQDHETAMDSAATNGATSRPEGG